MVPISEYIKVGSPKANLLNLLIGIVLYYN